MTITTAFTRGFTVTAHTPKMVLLVYFINFALSAFVALAVVDGMQNAAGNSMILQSLLQSFHGGNVVDFLNNDGSVLKAYLTQIKWVVLMYWIATIFLSGGIIKTLNKEKFTVSSFFAATGYYFWRYLGLAVLMLVVHLVTLAIFIIPSSIVLQAQWLLLSSERDLMLIIMGIAAVYLVVIGVLFMIADYAKFYMMLYDSVNFFKAYWKATGFVLRRFFRVYTLYLMIILISLVFLYLFVKLNEDIAMHTTAAIWITFLVQQLFIFVRTWFRIWLYSSELELFSAWYIKDSKEAFAKEHLQDIEQKIVANSNQVLTEKKEVKSTVEKTESSEPVNEQKQETKVETKVETTEVKKEETKKETDEHLKYMPPVVTNEVINAVSETDSTIKELPTEKISEAIEQQVEQETGIAQNPVEINTTTVPDVDYDVYDDYADDEARG